MKTLDWLDVGPVSAERDANLQHYFYDAGVSDSLVKDPTRFLMLGRKGAGKTAVFLHMKQQPTGLFQSRDVVVPLSTTEYNWHAHAALADQDKSGGSQYRDSWRFVIAVEAIRALSRQLESHNRNTPKELDRAHKVLNKIFGSPIPEWSELLRAKIFRLSKLRLPSASADIADQELSADAGEISFGAIERDDSLRARLTFNIEYLTAYLENALATALDGARIFVIFDRLDENWLSKELDACRRMIGGLIQAAEYFTQKFEGKLRPIVFLREDIFDSLEEINDRNKLRMDCSRTLMWDESTIEKLVLARINYFARLAGAPNLKQLDDLFDKPTVRSRSTPSKYIYQRTFCRPRDFVAFLTKIIEVAKENRRDGEPAEDASGKLSTQLIYEAEGAYSEYLNNEIVDEWSAQKPAIYGYLQILGNLKYTSFSPEQFEEEFKKVFKSGVADATIRSVLVFLFQVSIIGYKVGESGKRCFRCFLPSRRFEDADDYLVHFGLVKQLALTEGRLSNRAKDTGDADTSQS